MLCDLLLSEKRRILLLQSSFSLRISLSLSLAARRMPLAAAADIVSLLHQTGGRVLDFIECSSPIGLVELRQIRSLKNCGVNDGEICMIANSGPETVEEVYALIPSLKENRYENEEPIKEALSKLSKVKLPK